MADGGYILSRNEQMIRAIIDGTSYSTGYIQSRNEKILQAIIDGTSYDAEPQSRIEALLLHILNGTHTDVVPLSRNEAILTAIANGTEYTEEPQSRMEELLIEWLESRQAVEKTASGAIASFTTVLAEPLIKCICAFMATQDLHGQDKPYPAGGGKNLFSDVFSDYSKPASYWECPIILTQGTTYKISAELVGTAITGIVVGIAKSGSTYPYDEQKNVIKTNGTIADPAAFTIDDTWTDPKLLVYCADETAFNNIFSNYHVQLEVGSSATTYAPYSNICPIVPVSSVDVTRTGKNLVLGTITGKNINSSGLVVNDSSYKLAYAPIKQGQKYILTANNNLWGYFTDIPEQGSITYDGSRVLDSSKKFTAPISGYVAFRMASDYETPQIELGETASEYEAPNIVSDNVALGASYYGGNVDVVDGKITENYGKIVFDGTQSNSEFAFTTQDGKNRITWIPFQTIGKVGSKAFISDKLATASGYVALPDEWTVSNSAATVARCFIGVPNTITSVADWQSYVTSNPITLCYELATATEATTSDTATLNTLQGQNNVFNNTGNTEVTYLDKP